MKASPHLRSDVSGRELDVGALRSIDAAGGPSTPQQVQVSVFAGESTQEVAARIRASGGDVLSVDPRTVIALVPPPALEELASQRGGSEAILPHEFPTATNDRATAIMNIPADRVFHGLTLTGAGQTVGIVDSGLDTGDVATVHADLAGRVAAIVGPNSSAPSASICRRSMTAAATSSPTARTSPARWRATAPPPPRPPRLTVPRGVAPEARIHFTAVAQRVTWDRTRVPTTVPPFGLYGLPSDVGPLFAAAYAAGARVHTNSWGSSNTPTNTGIEGSYDAQTRAVDQYMFTHRDALVLFAAGNDGRDDNADVQIDPDSIGTPGTAKSVLTVGATENDRPHGGVADPGDRRRTGQHSPASLLSPSPATCPTTPLEWRCSPPGGRATTAA